MAPVSTDWINVASRLFKLYLFLRTQQKSRFFGKTGVDMQGIGWITKQLMSHGATLFNWWALQGRDRFTIGSAGAG